MLDKIEEVKNRVRLEYLKKWGLVFFLLVVLVVELVLLISYTKEKEQLIEKIEKYNKLVKTKEGKVKALERDLKNLSYFKKRIGTFSSEALVFAHFQSQVTSVAKNLGLDVRRVSISKTQKLQDGLYSTSILVYITGSPMAVLKFIAKLEEMGNGEAYVIKRMDIRLMAFRKRRDKYNFSMRGNFWVGVLWFKGGKGEEK